MSHQSGLLNPRGVCWEAPPCLINSLDLLFHKPSQTFEFPRTAGSPANAGRQLLPEAGATQERTLEAVSCTPLLGGDVAHAKTLRFAVAEPPTHRFSVRRRTRVCCWWS